MGSNVECENPKTRLRFSPPSLASSSYSLTSSSSLLTSSINGGSEIFSYHKACSTPALSVSAILAIFFCIFYFNAVTPPLVSLLPLCPSSITTTSSSSSSILRDGQNRVFSSSSSNNNNNNSMASHESFRTEVEITKEGIGGSKRETPEECDFSQGSWVRDDSYPLYHPESCPFIDEAFRCHENGRPDDDYTRWRWKPLGCNIPRFNAGEMLERLRGSRLVFVGDSIGRNQWESMLCMLSQAVPNKTHSIYEEHGEPITKHKGFLSFRFADYNCTVEYYRSPFLVPHGHPPPQSPASVKTSIKVDIMDWTSKLWRHADILVFNAGHWWTYERTIQDGAYFEEDGRVNMSMDVATAFRRAIQTWADWVENKVDLTKTQVFFRTYAPLHFRGGTKAMRGQCHQETKLEMSITRGKEEEKWTNLVVASQIQRLKKKTANINVGLLNITHLTNPRKDGHPSIYYLGKEVRPMQQQDCSHWCLPGVPDTWNDLLFATLLAKAKDPWGNQIKA